MLNSVIITGRLVKEIELENYGKGKNGGTYCRFSLAVSRGVKDEDGNDVADFINCTAFNGVSEVLDKFVDKGDMITVSGRLTVDKYTTKEGENRYSTYVKVNSVDLLPKAHKETKKSR